MPDDGNSDEQAAAPPALTPWSVVFAGGAVAGAVAGMLAANSDNSQLGVGGAALYFIFIFFGMNGGGRKFVASTIFAIVAAATMVLFRQFG